MALFCATTVMPTPMAMAQTQQQLDWCVGKGNPTQDLQISGCTAVIQSGRFVGADLANYFRNRGISYGRKGDTDHAIADYDEAIRVYPNGPMSYISRGFAYGTKGDYDRAIADYSEGIRLNPQYAWAFYYRGLAKQKKGDKAGAEADIAAARKIDPNVGK
jgi:tetratricopeptide (TPR) repeat protein